jgi:hypothetical protein
MDAAYLAARTARQDAKNRTIVQKEEVLDGVLGQLANHVESISGGDGADIMSVLGMDVRAAQAVTGDSPAPENLAASAGRS